MITPSLSINFTTASLNSRITFTRTTGASNPATYVNSSGYITAATNNEPRFDYDPVMLACKGLLIEESRVNLLLQSNTFNTSWAATRASAVSQSVTAPDGSSSAFKLTEDSTASNTHFIQQNVTGTLAAYTWSVYAKAGERNWLCLNANDATNRFTYFDLANGTIGTNAAGNTASIQALENGWYRCVVSRTAANTAISMRLFLATGDNVNTYSGDGTSGLYIYGAQLEAGAFATSYIPTTTTTLTRNADVATMTGTNFSDWWQASKGGTVVQAVPSAVSGIRPLVQYDDGTADNIIALRGNTTNPELYVVNGGTPQAQLDAGIIAANTAYSLTGWWATNDCKARKDSGAVVTDDTATIPTVTQARLGSDGANYLNGHLESISYYDTFSGQIYTRRKNKAVFSLL